jgi:serine/threonine protein kinase
LLDSEKAAFALEHSNAHQSPRQVADQRFLTAIGSIVSGKEKRMALPDAFIGLQVDGFQIIRILNPAAMGERRYRFLAINVNTGEQCTFTWLFPGPDAHREIQMVRDMERIMPGPPVIAEVLGSEGYFQEWRDQGDLFDYLEASGPLSEDVVGRMMFNVLRILRDMHTLRLAHRDVKPENIRLRPGGHNGLPQAFLSPLHYCESVPDGGFTDRVGTRHYWPPEVLLGQHYNESVDMWAFGVTLYILLTQRMPFGDPDSFEWETASRLGRYDESALDERNVSNEARDVIRRLLMVDADLRITAEEAMRHAFFRAAE